MVAHGPLAETSSFSRTVLPLGGPRDEKPGPPAPPPPGSSSTASPSANRRSKRPDPPGGHFHTRQISPAQSHFPSTPPGRPAETRPRSLPSAAENSPLPAPKRRRKLTPTRSQAPPITDPRRPEVHRLPPLPRTVGVSAPVPPDRNFRARRISPEQSPVHPLRRPGENSTPLTPPAPPAPDANSRVLQVHFNRLAKMKFSSRKIPYPASPFQCPSLHPVRTLFVSKMFPFSPKP